MALIQPRWHTLAFLSPNSNSIERSKSHSNSISESFYTDLYEIYWLDRKKIISHSGRVDAIKNEQVKVQIRRMKRISSRSLICNVSKRAGCKHPVRYCGKRVGRRVLTKLGMKIGMLKQIWIRLIKSMFPRPIFDRFPIGAFMLNLKVRPWLEVVWDPIESEQNDICVAHKTSS